MKISKILSISFLLIVTVYSIPYVKFCRHVASGKCVVVDIWFGQYYEKRMFPMKCVHGSCPNGTKCDPDERCWDEVKLQNLWFEMSMKDGEWK